MKKRKKTKGWLAAKTKLKELQNDTDLEGARREADDVLCDLLTELGYADVVYEYQKVDKLFI